MGSFSAELLEVDMFGLFFGGNWINSSRILLPTSSRELNKYLRGSSMVVGADREYSGELSSRSI